MISNNITPEIAERTALHSDFVDLLNEIINQLNDLEARIETIENSIR